MPVFCEKVEIANNEKYGRHLIASMDLDAGDEILKEAAILIAPQWDVHSNMKCSECFEDSFIMCKKCSVFPLCLDCTSHNEYDCEFFSSIGSKISKNILVKNYATFALLKLLLLLENPKTAERTKTILDDELSFQQYEESTWQELSKNVIEPIMKSGISEVLTNVKVTEKLLHSLCFNIDANAFEVSGPDGESLMGVFEWGTKLPHNCVPNTAVSVNNEFHMKIYAAVSIQKGDVIFNSYTNPMMGTSQRNHYLKINRNLQCDCLRCLDPVELGTHMSSLKCKNCDGYAICDMTKNANWICTECKTCIDGVRNLLAEVGEEMVTAQDDLESYEHLLQRYGNHFHPNHFMLIDIKQNIAVILKSLTHKKKILERRVKICGEMLPVVRAVLPGVSKLYAIALYEYLVPFLELAQMEFSDKSLNKQEYIVKLQKGHNMANESLNALRFEFRNSPEGQLMKRINQQLQNIETNLQKMNVKK